MNDLVGHGSPPRILKCDYEISVNSLSQHDHPTLDMNDKTLGAERSSVLSNSKRRLSDRFKG